MQMLSYFSLYWKNGKSNSTTIPAFDFHGTVGTPDLSRLFIIVNPIDRDFVDKAFVCLPKSI